jgi:hypothetical protein
MQATAHPCTPGCMQLRMRCMRLVHACPVRHSSCSHPCLINARQTLLAGWAAVDEGDHRSSSDTHTRPPSSTPRTRGPTITHSKPNFCAVCESRKDLAILQEPRVESQESRDHRDLHQRDGDERERLYTRHTIWGVEWMVVGGGGAEGAFVIRGGGGGIAAVTRAAYAQGVLMLLTVICQFMSSSKNARMRGAVGFTWHPNQWLLATLFSTHTGVRLAAGACALLCNGRACHTTAGSSILSQMAASSTRRITSM